MGPRCAKRPVTKLLASPVTVWNRRRCLRLAQRGQRPSDKPVGDHGGSLPCSRRVSPIRGSHVSGMKSSKQPLTTPTRERPSNQVNNNHHRQQWTPAVADGRSDPGQTCRSPGSSHRYLASDEETAGSIRPPRRGFPPANLLSHRLPNLMVVSDFGSRMGATMSAQMRLTLDAVIVAAGRFLTSLDIGLRPHVTWRPGVVVIAVAVRTASRSAGKPRRPLSSCRGQALQFWAA